MTSVLTSKRIYKVNDISKLSAKAVKAAKAAKNTYKINTNFYFMVRNGKTYSIKRSALMLIKIFKDMTDANKLAGATIETAVILERINIDDKYELNTSDVIDFVHSYLLLWEDNPTASDYVTDIVQTSNVEQIIRAVDLELINNYISLLITSDVFTLLKTPIEKKKALLKSLHLLVKNIDGYLHIASLTKKLHAYIACILWGCSMRDIHLTVGV